MEKIQFILVTPLELQDIVNKAVSTSMASFVANFRPEKEEEYLTRQEVAKILKVDISTVHNWTKSGKLKPYGIGARIYFLRSEIEKCLTPLKTK